MKLPLQLSLRTRPRGFALIVTISIMVLLTLVSLGLLSLSTVTVRTTTQGAALAEARANARLSLLLAIGELQKQMGPDQRVSANGAIVSDSAVEHPHWTGVWDSWRAGPTDATETNPDEPSEHQTIAGSKNDGMHPTYDGQRKDHFRSWLVSLGPGEARKVSSPTDLTLDGNALPDKDANAVQLVGAGVLGPDNEADHVSARLLSVQAGSSRGRYGWWIGDESQKARIMHDSHESADRPSLAERIFRHQAPGSTGTSTIEGLENLEDDKQLAGLPSLRTLDLVDGAREEPSESYHHVTPFSYQVLADVREGGLKRDLTTLLERPIKDDRSGFPTETGDAFMLYRFDTDGQERVPLQDLSAYYQLYDDDPAGRKGRKAGVNYSSNLLPRGIQVSAPDFGAKQDDPESYLRQYTSLYRNPVPIKIQFLLSLTAEPRPPGSINRTNRDTHKLQLGITPSVTFWNPTNLPIVMPFGDPNRYAHMLRLMNLPLNIRWIKNGGRYRSELGTHMTWATQQYGAFKANIFSLYYSGTRSIVFEPGEVRVFSLPYRPGNMAFRKTDRFHEPHEVEPGWDPSAFLKMPRSDRNTDPANIDDNCLTFEARDKISFEITADSTEIASGIGLSFFTIQNTYQQHSDPGRWHFRTYQTISRYGQGGSTAEFNASLLGKGFPGGDGVIRSAPRSGSQIIARATQGEPWPFLQFALMAGSETHEASNGGAFAGRKFTSRPFLHSTALSPSFIDRDDHDSFYNYGWNWWVDEINSVFEANVQVSRENQGYYGGGYTPESGTTHVVQQEIPVVPPMSIAALSHAHLGGFSLATDAVSGQGQDPGAGYQGLVDPFGKTSWQQVTATGQGGLFPHTLQAIGNSYAHPHIPADEAYTGWVRYFDTSAGPRTKTFADHSYLANKALWDEFFFSSISPAPSSAEIFGSDSNLSATKVAEEFFFGSDPLPNRRIVPYMDRLDRDRFDTMFRDSKNYIGGLGDLISSHLMVEGPFNVNSTSVEAWKVFFSSLKGKKVAYLDKNSALTAGVDLDLETPTGTPVSSFSLPNGKPRVGSPKSPSDPAQWGGWRDLGDDEIEDLAIAMVEQVKLRGPFLSLSEFVNRRLDSKNKELSLKGALQAALDDKEVSINEGFRDRARVFNGAELGKMNPEFPEALEGPVAYGSAAYVDQADILRNFASQLTPRGDTFVIRTYGDALDAQGNVQARAWCEAIVQRVPEYLDPEDDPHLKQDDLKSDANKDFGRKLRLVSFRFLSNSEI